MGISSAEWGYPFIIWPPVLVWEHPPDCNHFLLVTKVVTKVVLFVKPDCSHTYKRILQFFLENQTMEEEEVVEETADLDLDDCATKVHETLNTAEGLAKRLGDLNQDIIEWLVNYANNKASNKYVGALFC